MITYKDHCNGTVSVYIDRKKVGVIREQIGGFRYHPNGGKTAGELFKTLAACKRSLEAE